MERTPTTERPISSQARAVARTKSLGSAPSAVPRRERFRHGIYAECRAYIASEHQHRGVRHFSV